MNDKKTNDGFYVVMQLVDEVVQGEPTLLVVGSQQAHRPEEAVRLLCAEKGLAGKFLAMPQRSWRLFEAAPTTVVSVKAVE